MQRSGIKPNEWTVPVGNFGRYTTSTPCRYFVSSRHKIAGKVFESLPQVTQVTCSGALIKIAQALPELIFKKCAGRDSNLRRLMPADLQSALVDRLSTDA